ELGGGVALHPLGDVEVEPGRQRESCALDHRPEPVGVLQQRLQRRVIITRRARPAGPVESTREHTPLTGLDHDGDRHGRGPYRWRRRWRRGPRARAGDGRKVTNTQSDPELGRPRCLLALRSPPERLPFSRPPPWSLSLPVPPPAVADASSPAPPSSRTDPAAAPIRSATR